MASKYGVEYTNIFQTDPGVKVDVSKWQGKLRVMYGTYELSADLASGDKIYLGRLPKGAIVYNAMLAFDDLDGSGGTIDLGYEYNQSGDESLTDDLDGFLADVDVTSAGVVGSVEQALIDSIGLEMSGEADVVAVIDGDTDATTGTVKAVIFYAID